MKKIFINLFILSLILPSLLACASGDNYSQEYKNGVFHIYDNGKEIWAKKSDPGQLEIVGGLNNQLVFIFKFEPSFEIGDVWVYAFDKRSKKILDTLQLQQLDRVVDEEKTMIFMAKENRYSFAEPGAPLWPSIYSFHDGFFEKLEDRKYYDFNLLSQETSSFIGNAYLVCNGKIKGCFYEGEYNSAVKQLQAIFHEQ